MNDFSDRTLLPVLQTSVGWADFVNRWSIPAHQAHVMHLLLWSVVQGAAGLVVHRGLRWVSLSSLMLFLLASMRPELLYLCMGIANGVLTAVVLVVWCRTEMVDPTR